jgi:hypothetical protein
MGYREQKLAAVHGNGKTANVPARLMCRMMWVEALWVDAQESGITMEQLSAINEG